MKEFEVSKATLGRVPTYLKFLKKLSPQTENVSATTISKELGLGEVQVRKDMQALCGAGKPKVGYSTIELIQSLESFLSNDNAVIIGAGQLGRALLDYDGFKIFGLSILAAFDTKLKNEEISSRGKPILPMENFEKFCKDTQVKIGIIAVPSDSAQEVCNIFYKNSIKTMWCFASCQLYKPADAIIQYENLALSLAHLKLQIKN